MKNTNLAGLLALPLMVFMLGLPASAADSAAPTTCKDGTTSTATGRGACSGHGGVQKAAANKADAAAPAEPAAAPAAGRSQRRRSGFNEGQILANNLGCPSSLG